MMLCQRTELSPRSFLIQGVEETPGRDSIETGASATVYHGRFKDQPVAIKSFRLYYNPEREEMRKKMAKVKKVCWFAVNAM